MAGVDMETARVSRLARIGSALLGTLLITGCTFTYKVSTDPVADYSSGQKLPTSIELNLPDALCKYTWEHKTALGDSFRMELGPALSSNAEAMARGLFQAVTVSHGDPGSEKSSTAAILTPRVVSVERAMGANSFSDMKTIIDLEWSLSDPKGNLIWVQTLQGIGKAKTGNIFSHKSEARKQGRLAIQDVFQKSAAAITNSPEIRAFAAKHN
jgi:PBP1b-binding outer membrane lipoprotein LpoB